MRFSAIVDVRSAAALRERARPLRASYSGHKRAQVVFSASSWIARVQARRNQNERHRFRVEVANAANQSNGCA
jgi:hypothetical protein